MESTFGVFTLYLFYGLAFFAIGVAITSRNTRASNLKIAGPLWLLALFAYSHAFHEWFEMYRRLAVTDFPELLLPWVQLSRLMLVFMSFTFLLLFGLRVLCLVVSRRRWLLVLLPAVLSILLIVVVMVHWHDPSSAFFLVVDERIRNLIGLPSATLAGLSLILYSRTVTDISLKGARNFSHAGWALIIYGVLTGVVPSGTLLLPFNAPVELFRTLSAFALLHFMMHALTTFDEERALLIEERLIRFAKSEKLHSLGQLAFGIAHEINTPLSNISLNMELLKKSLHPVVNDAGITRRCQAIERNLDRASKIAQELLTFATDKETTLIPTDLNAVLQSTLELLGARRKAYTITIDSVGSQTFVPGIPWKLEEVFLNILINAMDAMPDGGTIRIHISATGSAGTLVAITDSGTGIPETQLHRVLDPFFTTKDVGQGTGLGLSICFGIMEMHGGSIELTNSPEGGTAVTLSFPQGDEAHGPNSGC